MIIEFTDKKYLSIADRYLTANKINATYNWQQITVEVDSRESKIITKLINYSRHIEPGENYDN